MASKGMFSSVELNYFRIPEGGIKYEKKKENNIFRRPALNYSEAKPTLKKERREDVGG